MYFAIQTKVYYMKASELRITRQYSKNSITIRGDVVTILEYSGSKVVGTVTLPLEDFKKICVTFFTVMEG